MISHEKFLNITNKYYTNNCNGDSTEPITECINRSNLLLVAVHAINHYSGKMDENKKLADLNTGAIVEILGQKTNCSTIINNFRDKSINPFLGPTNADIDIINLKKKYEKLILLDIHGAKDNDIFDIAIGTSSAPTESQLYIIKLFKDTSLKFNLNVVVNIKGYSATAHHTITYRALKHDILALQIEIVKKYRDHNQMDNINHMLQFLTETIDRVNKNIEIF